MHTHFTLIVDGVDIKALVYVFFKKTHPREVVSQLTETNMTENLLIHLMSSSFKTV